MVGEVCRLVHPPHGHLSEARARPCDCFGFSQRAPCLCVVLHGMGVGEQVAAGTRAGVQRDDKRRAGGGVLPSTLPGKAEVGFGVHAKHLAHSVHHVCRLRAGGAGGGREGRAYERCGRRHQAGSKSPSQRRHPAPRPNSVRVHMQLQLLQAGWINAPRRPPVACPAGGGNPAGAGPTGRACDRGPCHAGHGTPCSRSLRVNWRNAMECTAGRVQRRAACPWIAGCLLQPHPPNPPCRGNPPLQHVSPP